MQALSRGHTHARKCAPTANHCQTTAALPAAMRGPGGGGLAEWACLVALCCLSPWHQPQLASAAAAAPAPSPHSTDIGLELKAELRAMRARSPDGILRFTDSQLTKFGRKDRGYHLVVFLTARQVQSKPALRVAELRTQFALTARALLAGPDPDAAFFIEMVYEDSPKVFYAVGVNQVPFIFSISPNTKASLVSMEVPKTHKMHADTVKAEYPWKAEVMVAFFSKAPHGLRFGPIIRPTLLNNPWFPLVATLAVLGGGVLVWQCWSTVFMSPALWAVGAIAVFWFSVSGGMYNIIRQVPMLDVDKDGRMRFFLGSRSGQLGAEGFIMGTGYVLFSLAVALLTHGLPRLRSGALRHGLAYGLMGLMGFLGLNIWKVYQDKTGSGFSSYLIPDLKVFLKAVGGEAFVKAVGAG